MRPAEHTQWHADHHHVRLACTLPSPTISAIPWATAHSRAHMAVKKFTSRQNPNKQLDLRFCAKAGCEALSDMLVGDLPFSRSAMFSFSLVLSTVCSAVSVIGSSTSRGGAAPLPTVPGYNTGALVIEAK